MFYWASGLWIMLYVVNQHTQWSHACCPNFLLYIGSVDAKGCEIPWLIIMINQALWALSLCRYVWHYGREGKLIPRTCINPIGKDLCHLQGGSVQCNQLANKWLVGLLEGWFHIEGSLLYLRLTGWIFDSRSSEVRLGERKPVLLGSRRTSILSAWLICPQVCCSSTEVDEDRGWWHPLVEASCHVVTRCFLVVDTPWGARMWDSIRTLCAFTCFSFSSRSLLNVTLPPPTPADRRKEQDARPGVTNPWATDQYWFVACQEPGRTAGERWATERSFVCCSHHSRYRLNYSAPRPMEELSSLKPVPGAKKVRDHC